MDKKDEPIRIVPTRRKTLVAEQWGIHQVPGMLNDFKRHTSHANIAASMSANNSFADISTAMDTSTLKEEKSVSLLSSIPGIVSLPTGLLAAEDLAFTSQNVLNTVTVISGLLLILSGLLGLLDGRRALASNTFSRKNTAVLALGIVTLVSCACILGSTKTAICTIISLNISYNLKSSWYYLVSLLVMLTYDIGKASADDVHPVWSIMTVCVGYLALATSSYCLSLPNPSTIATDLAFGLGVALFIPGIILVPHSWNSVVLVAITSWALGVFLLVRHDIIPTRYNAVVSATIGTAMESLLRGASPWAILLAAVSMALPITKHSSSLEDGMDDETAASWGIIDSILAHDDTRNIFYFLLLNFSFMLIQLLYSLLSHSLGLLSDSIHMFFDCIALLVGLVASILSKFPPSSRFPYGLGKVETVSGFTNGCLLIGISGGVIAEAIERISHPVELEKTHELLIVSTLGLVVNLIGIFAFHHGHDHGHSHEHSHSHAHSHSHEPSHHEHNHEPCDGDNDSHAHSHSSHSHNHNHTGEVSQPETNHSINQEAAPHKNENMYGIFLHIMADTLGSVGVVVSTVLIKYTGWAGFDPLASIFIAILIFASAIPLITSSAKTLLLSLSDDQEYHLREILNDISITSGVASYTMPKFWADGETVRGVIHVQYHKDANSTVVRNKVEAKLKENGIDGVFIQVEREGTNCWCHSSK